MRSEPICAYVYINGEIIQSSSANAVFRGDKIKSLLLNPTMTLPNIITANNYLAFAEEEIPAEGKGHNKALHVSVKCMDHLFIV